MPTSVQSVNSQNGINGQDLESAVHSSEPRGLLTPESLAEVMSSARLLLVEQATECLSVCFLTMQPLPILVKEGWIASDNCLGMIKTIINLPCTLTNHSLVSTVPVIKVMCCNLSS